MSSTGIELRGTVFAYVATVPRWGLVNLTRDGVGRGDTGLSKIDEILEPFEGRRVSVRIEIVELPE